MQNFFLKTFSVVAVSSMAFSLAGCAKNTGTTDAVVDNTTNEQADNAAIPEAANTPTTQGTWTKQSTGSAGSAAAVATSIATANAETKPSEFYQVYSASKVDAAIKAGKQVALFFYSATSDISKRVDKDLANNATLIGKDRVVFRVDFDKETDLKTTYNVKSEHTAVYLNKDKTAKRLDVNAVGVTQIVTGF